MDSLLLMEALCCLVFYEPVSMDANGVMILSCICRTHLKDRQKPVLTFGGCPTDICAKRMDLTSQNACEVELMVMKDNVPPSIFLWTFSLKVKHCHDP